jgi:hypothetical protein
VGKLFTWKTTSPLWVLWTKKLATATFETTIRVTRLGCLLWAVFFTEVAHILGLLLYTVEVCTNFDKNGLGYILGDFFFTNSSEASFLNGFSRLQ